MLVIVSAQSITVYVKGLCICVGCWYVDMRIDSTTDDCAVPCSSAYNQ